MVSNGPPSSTHPAIRKPRTNDKEGGAQEHPEELTTIFRSRRPYRRHPSPVNRSDKFSAFYCFSSLLQNNDISLSLQSSGSPAIASYCQGTSPSHSPPCLTGWCIALAAQLLQGPAGLLRTSGRDTGVHCVVRARPGKDKLPGKPRGGGILGCLASPGQKNTSNTSCCPPRTNMGRGVGVLHSLPPCLTSALRYCHCHP